MKKAILICFLLAAGQLTSYCQAKTEILNNKLVIDMFKGGLSTQTILSKISTSTCRFDLTSTSLIALKKAGFPGELIDAMVNTGSAEKQPAPTAQLIANKTSDGAKAAKIDLLNHVYVLNNNAPAPLEKSLATTKTKMKALGYGGTNFVLEIDGTTSNTQLKPENATAFVIKTGSETPPDLVLYKLKVSKKSRQAVTGKFNLGGMQGSQGGLTVNIAKAEDGVFKITFSKPLEPGEYFFQARAMTNQSTNAEVFPFTVL